MDTQRSVKCANCGFLHGIAVRGVSHADIYFDPDRLRKVESASDIIPGFKLTSYAYLHNEIVHTHRQGRASDGGPTVESEAHLVAQPTIYGLTYTSSIGCFRNVWRVQARWTGWADDTPVEELYQKIVEEIQLERTCLYFFEYVPGLSMSGHMEAQHEERRFQREEYLQRELAKQLGMIQWVAIGISICALFISIFIPIIMREDITKIVITEPVIVIEPTPTPIPTPTPTITPIP